MAAGNMLYFGDNLEILRNRDYFPDSSVDLVYLDPPFNSNQDYNVLFAEKNGTQSAAQIQAFSDTWHWDVAASAALGDAVSNGGPRVASAMKAFQTLLGGSDMLAYLSMMAPRLVELRRVLKPTGSIYLHCDTTASHYLKILMDSTFGPKNFRTEIAWKRQSAHNDARQGRKQHGRIHDVILFYTASDDWTWNSVYVPYDEKQLETGYRWAELPTGKLVHLKRGEEPPAGARLCSMGDLTGPGGVARGSPEYELMGVTRAWRFSKEKMDELVGQGRVVQTAPGNVPMQKRYLDEMPGVVVQDIWTDLKPIAAQAAERLGYPTQKPEALLERIIKGSSNPGETVLDPFCGCGTTIAAAQKLDRRWIGIDITYLAIGLVERRLKDTFGPDVASSWKVIGEPRTIADAEELARRDRYQFQWWALDQIDARPKESTRKKGADQGVDGIINFQESPGGTVRTILVQVKSGHVHRDDVATLKGDMDRESAEIGVLLSLEEPTEPMKGEAAGAGVFQAEDPIGAGRPSYPKVQLLTVREILEGGKSVEYPRQGNVTFRRAPASPPKPRGRTKRLSETTFTES
jgi:DNA modification methylase